MDISFSAVVCKSKVNEREDEWRLFSIAIHIFSYYTIAVADSEHVNRFLTALVDKSVNELMLSSCVELIEVYIISIWSIRFL